MTSREAYFEFQVLMNKNASLRNINIPPHLYVLLYNRETKISYRRFIKGSIIDIHDISELLVTDEKLQKAKEYQEYVEYYKPTNFFDFVDSRSTTKRGNCTGVTVNYLYKPKDLKLKNSDSFYVNFDHEESICNLSENFVQIYKKDFDLVSSYISFYREISEIDISGYKHLDGTMSTDIEPDLSDRMIHLVNNWIVLEVMREFENTGGINISKDRINS